MTQPPAAESCYRHSDRPTLIRCQRCRRPVCPECMVPASVGVQCVDCVREGARFTRADEGPFGGRRSADPRITSWVLIGINVAVFVAVLLTGGSYGRLSYALSLSPTGQCLVDDASGSYYPGATAALCATMPGAYWSPGVTDGAFWQVLTSAFAHAGILHLAANMLALFFLGPPLEQVLGRARFLAVYLISALAGSAAVMWLAAPDSSALGASGAIFGLMGALFVIARKAGGNYQLILIWLGINVALTVVGGAGISWQAHLGGLLGGAASAAVLVLPSREHRARWQWPGLAVLTLLMLGLIAARAVMLQ